MQWTVKQGRAQDLATDVLAIPVTEELKLAPELSRVVGKKAGEQLAEAADAAGFRGGNGALHPVLVPGLAAGSVLLVGLGSAETFTLETLRRAAAAAALKARDMGQKRLAVVLPPPGEIALDAVSMGRCWIEGAELALSSVALLKTDTDGTGGARDAKGRAKIDVELPRKGIVNVAQGTLVKELRRGVNEGVAFAAGTLLARRLVNLPPNHLTPRLLAAEARALARDAGYRCQVLGPAQLKKKHMGGILGVAQGSREDPCLIVLESKSAPRGAPRVALVGKGVTFDAGGISIKPAPKMDVMKCDMAGAAAVLGAALTLARMKVPVRLQVLVPAVENLPDGGAIKPADVLTMASGKTVEVLNTDAEGRLILADALHTACIAKPDYVIDIATLTGACELALGKLFAGVMGNSGELTEVLNQAGGETFERVWPLPLVDEHRKAMEGTVSDLKNLGPREGGALTAAAFLAHFVPDDIAWAHLDIAGMAWSEAQHPLGPRGGTGYGARLLTRAVQILAG